MEQTTPHDAARDAAEHSTATSAPETNTSTDAVSRRALVGGSVAGIMGLALTQMQNASAQSDTGPQIVVTLPKSTMLLLPQKQAVMVTECALQNRGVAMLYEFFTARGMRLIPERAKVAVYLDPETCDAGAVLIWPTFRTFDAGAAGHEAASIIAVGHNGKFYSTTASHVQVNHNPFQLQKFTQLEIDPNTGAMTQRSASREQVASLSPEELARLLGPLAVGSDAVPAPSMLQSDLPRLAAGVYSELINDGYARPLYPPGAITRLLGDTRLVQKWSETQRLRYNAALGRIPVCSSSSSCNGCTSTSTSIINLSF